MAANVFVITRDKSWRIKLKRGGNVLGTHFCFVRDLTSPTVPHRLGKSDWVIVDTGALPPAESPEINFVHRLLRGKPVVAVYNPGSGVGLPDYRKSYIAGAADLVEKPLTNSEIVRFLGQPPKPGGSMGGGEPCRAETRAPSHSRNP